MLLGPLIGRDALLDIVKPAVTVGIRTAKEESARKRSSRWIRSSCPVNTQKSYHFCVVSVNSSLAEVQTALEICVGRWWTRRCNSAYLRRTRLPTFAAIVKQRQRIGSCWHITDRRRKIFFCCRKLWTKTLAMLYGSAAAMIVGRTKTLAMLYGFAAAMITSTQAFDPRLSTHKFNILLAERLVFLRRREPYPSAFWSAAP